jgi:TRAP-type mannitol/chloroaromatic compound transport system permease large subunit
MLCIVHSDSVAFKITTPHLLLYMYGNLMLQSEFREFFFSKSPHHKNPFGAFFHSLFPSITYFVFLGIVFVSASLISAGNEKA